MQTVKIVVVDDDYNLGGLLSDLLSAYDFDTYFIGAHEVAMRIDRLDAQVAVIDYERNGSPIDGVDILRHFKKINPDIKTVLISGKLDLIPRSEVNLFDSAWAKPFNIGPFVGNIEKLLD